MKKQLLVLTTLSALLSFSTSYALKFKLPPPGQDIVGQVFSYVVQPGESLGQIGRRFDMGYMELREANPQLDQEVLAEQDRILIPQRFILPPAPRAGIVVNLAELRMYYYPDNGLEVYTYPVGIGRVDWETPVGLGKITAKVKDPTWYAPLSIRQERAKDGVIIPAVVKPGPDNPLGRYKMALSFAGYLIHSTNMPEGVGFRSSSGCIRMLPEDAEELFNMVKVGTSVNIINKPYKVGWMQNQLFLEAHSPLQEQDEKESNLNLTPMIEAIAAQISNKQVKVNWDTAKQIAEEEEGMPQLIGALVKTS